MAHFGSFAAIRAASVEELAAVPGITEQLSQAIKIAIGVGYETIDLDD